MNLPTIKQLKYFLALVDKQHFGHAAAACFVSQSAFSTAIQELEATAEAQLVARTNRQVTITPAGREVARQARLTLDSLERMLQSVRGPAEPLTGKLHLGIIPTIAPFILPKVLRKLRHNYPELQLFLTEAQTADLHSKLLSGDIDVALLALPFELPATQTQPLFRDHFMLAYSDKTKRLDPSNYAFSKLPDGSVMLLEEGHCLRDHALDACKLRGTAKINQFSASSLLSLVEMVDADLALTYLPEMAASSALLKSTRVRLLPIGKRNYRTIGLAWHKGSARADEFKMLGQAITVAAGHQINAGAGQPSR